MYLPYFGDHYLIYSAQRAWLTGDDERHSISQTRWRLAEYCPVDRLVWPAKCFMTVLKVPAYRSTER